MIIFKNLIFSVFANQTSALKLYFLKFWKYTFSSFVVRGEHSSTSWKTYSGFIGVYRIIQNAIYCVFWMPTGSSTDIKFHKGLSVSKKKFKRNLRSISNFLRLDMSHMRLAGTTWALLSRRFGHIRTLVVEQLSFGSISIL